MKQTSIYSRRDLRFIQSSTYINYVNNTTIVIPKIEGSIEYDNTIKYFSRAFNLSFKRRP